MFCARCGQQIAEGTQACPHCGQPPTIAWQSAPTPAFAPYPAPAYSYAAPAALSGVQGWLLFFCISLTILWPIWILASYVLSYVMILRLHRHFVLTTLLSVGWLRLVFGIATGILVWIKKPAAITFLRIYYLVGVALMVWTLNSWVHAFMHAPARPTLYVGVVFSVGPSLIFLVSGLIYFSVSKRVRNTLGSNLFG